MSVVDLESVRREQGSDRGAQMDEMATVSAICNRVARMLGMLDREGLQRDLTIVQAHCPLDLEALAGSPDRVFVEELTAIIESADRASGSLRSGYSSRYLCHPEAC